MATRGTQPTLLCFSHLRWNFVYQRPQHLMSRAAREFQVYFFEEPIVRPDAKAGVEIMADPCGVTVVTPVVPEPGLEAGLIEQFIAVNAPGRRVLWYYTPMMRRATAHLGADVIVYDCMDELSAFRGAPAELTAREAELLADADIVFTGGLSLYMAKSAQHRNVHAFPSSVDVAHFAGARGNGFADPADQCGIGRPRLGFFGVIDERLDTDLLDRLAAMKPEWCFVMIGPVVKTDPAMLPRRDNIHWLGGRNYRDLPAYLANWDVGLMPFAMNEATRFISPTKTPEYLAAGLPVVSAPITDVVTTYGRKGLVQIADTAEGFAAAAEHALGAPRDGWLADVDAHLASMSWERTWASMLGEMRRRAVRRSALRKRPVAVEATHAGV